MFRLQGQLVAGVFVSDDRYFTEHDTGPPVSGNCQGG